MLLKGPGILDFYGKTAAVISDCHIGDVRLPTASFSLLSKTLASLAKREDQPVLVLAGDFIDRNPKFQFKERHRILFRQLQKFKHVVWLGGNHDWDWTGLGNSLASHITWYPSIYIKSGGKTVHISHGHEVDWMASKLPWVDRFGGWFVRWCYRKFGVNFHRWFSPKEFKYSKAMAKIVSNTSADIVISGHSHFAGIKKLKGRVYINTGDWLNIDHATLVLVKNGAYKYFDKSALEGLI